MDKEFWLQRWEQNQIGFHKDEINSHLKDFWTDVGLQGQGTVFVPLCGKSRDLLWLLAQGHRVIGVELSPLAIKAFFQENGLQPEVRDEGRFTSWRAGELVLLQGDFFDLDAGHLHECAAVYDRASLIALPPDMRARYAKHILSILPADASMLLVTMEYPQEKVQGPPFSVHEEEVRALYESEFQVAKLFELDILDELPRIAASGVEYLTEKVYRLSRRTL